MKKWIFKILCSKVIGRVIFIMANGNIPSVRWKGFRFRMPKEHTSYMNHAAVFWGFYESAELRLLNKYLVPELPVIELGGSLGIVSSHIISQINKPFTIVEANPRLIETIGLNTSRYNYNHVPVQIVNKAVNYTASTVSFAVSNNNTESSVITNSNADENNQHIIKIPSTSLTELASNLQEFTLVCDIEGAEVELLQNDMAALTKCRYVFMEVHKTSFGNKNYNQNDVIDLLLLQGFQLIERDGHVVYMRKN